MNINKTKERIIKELSINKIKGIGWLQKKYKISFRLAKEIYLEHCNKS